MLRVRTATLVVALTGGAALARLVAGGAARASLRSLIAASWHRRARRRARHRQQRLCGSKGMAYSTAYTPRRAPDAEIAHLHSDAVSNS